MTIVFEMRCGAISNRPRFQSAGLIITILQTFPFGVIRPLIFTTGRMSLGPDLLEHIGKNADSMLYLLQVGETYRLLLTVLKACQSIVLLQLVEWVIEEVKTRLIVGAMD